MNKILILLFSILFSSEKAYAAEEPGKPLEEAPKSVNKIEFSNKPLVNIGEGIPQLKPQTSTPKKTITQNKPTPKKPSNVTVTHITKKKNKPKPPKRKHVAKKQNTSHWSYEGKGGPEHWGDLNDKFSTCKNGKNQSPIDIKIGEAVGTSGLNKLKINYQDAILKMHNNGHTIEVTYPRGSYIMVGKNRYNLLQFHFHTPSEHLKDGLNYPMEMHLVHQDANGNLAVLGILFREGKHNSNLDNIFEYLPKTKGKPKRYLELTINPKLLLPEEKTYYKYSGSLTTPPCSEGVYWMVLKHDVEIGPSQIDKIQAIMGKNARPIQNENARTVLKSYADRANQADPYFFGGY